MTTGLHTEDSMRFTNIDVSAESSRHQPHPRETSHHEQQHSFACSSGQRHQLNDDANIAEALQKTSEVPTNVRTAASTQMQHSHDIGTLGLPSACNAHVCNPNSASAVLEVRQTYSRQKRQRTACSCTGAADRSKQTADYTWLQGVDETSITEPFQRGGHGKMCGLLWSSHATGQTETQDSAEASSIVLQEAGSVDGAVIW